MKVLYVRGGVVEVDDTTIAQLRAAASELDITTVQGSADALAEIRRTGGWHALLVSPTLPQNETLAIIASLRRDRVQIAIVPVVDESHQDLFAAAVASGADDVLMRRGQALVNVTETLARIRQSPHLFPVEQRRRISVLYAGRDSLVWNLLEQVPFVKAEKVVCGVDGSCPVRAHGSGDGSVRTDVVVIDEQPGDAHPLQVLKSVKAQASDLPVVVLTSTGSGDVATAALELGADDTVLKTGIFRRRLIATLRRVHQRLELTAQQAETKAREERLRQIVENVPTGITVIASDGAILAMNAAALRLFGAAKPRDVVGRDFRHLVSGEDHTVLTDLIHRVTKGEAASVDFRSQGADGSSTALTIRGVVLERDAKGGRGVVASITRTGTDPNPVADGAQAAELATLQASLQRMERHYAELEEARATEREAWETERRRLETRLETAEKVVAERAALAARLDEVTAELARTSHTFAAERQSLEGRLQELEASARDAASAGHARAELEGTLEAVRQELRQAVEAHALERSGWQAIRQELEGKANEFDQARHAQADHAANLASLESRLSDLDGTLTRERDAWRATRDDLERELRHAREALWNEHTDRDQQRTAFDVELGKLRDLLSEERATWAATRTEITAALDATRHELDEARRTWASIESDLRDQLAAATQALEAERLQWQSSRADFERDLAAARDQAPNHDTWSAERAKLEGDLLEVRGLLDNERATWNTTETRLVGDLERAQEATRAIAEEYDATRTRLEQERDEARQQLNAERSDIDVVRSSLERERDDARRLLDEERQNSASLHSSGHQEREQLGAQLAQFTSEVLDLRNREQDAQQRRSELEVERDDLRRQLDATRAEAESNRSSLERERDDARRQADEDRWTAEQYRTTVEAELVQLRDALQWSRGEVENLRAREQQASDMHAQLAVERDDLRRQLYEAAMATASLRAELERERDEARQQASDERRNAEAARLTAEAELADVRGALQWARGEADDLRAREQQALDLQTQFAGDRDDLHRRLAAADEAAATMRADLERERDDARRQLDEERSRWFNERATFEWNLNQARTDAANEQQTLQSALSTAQQAHVGDQSAWDERRHALESDLQRVVESLAAAEARWAEERAALLKQIAESNHDRQEHQRLQDSIHALRSDYAAMVQSLAGEQARHDDDLQRIESLRSDLADAERRADALERDLEQTTVDAEALIRRRELEHNERLRGLEHDLTQSALRLARVSDEAERARTALHAEYARAAESHNRLVASDLFGYAVTTTAGELVRCNDAFARMFGFSDAPDAMTRMSGRLFPGLAGRTTLVARLEADGHVDRLESCLERIDGRAIRVIESATLLVDPQDQADEETLIEHVMLSTSAGPDSAELKAKRLEEVGALTTAMLPDIEGLVTTLQERAAERPESPAEVAALAAQVASLIRQLGAFSRRQIRSADPVDLGQSVLRVEPMLVRLVGDYIAFSTDIRDASPVTAQADDVDQLLTSMVTLARDLLPAGGSVVVETRQLGDGDEAGRGPMLSVNASGYGVLFPERPTALEQVAERSGGRLRIAGEPGWSVRLEVAFPRCGGRSRATWSWIRDEE